MSTESIRVTAVIPTDVDTIRESWIDGDQHAAMTGAAAASSADGSFTAWDGYITGKTLEVEPGRIVQSWRTSTFPADAADSRVEITLEAVEGGTRVTLDHSVIPAGQGADYDAGWFTHYFDPMKKFFG